MRITRDELIAELQRIPTNVEIEFRGPIEMHCGECEAPMLDNDGHFQFDGITFGNPAYIRLGEYK